MSELEQRAIGKLIAKAESMGLGDQVPETLRDFVDIGHGSNGGATVWTRDNPDAEPTFGCCIGNDLMGAGYCNCWVPDYDVEQAQPVPVAGRRDISTSKGMCHDCAYRPGSPERGEGGGYLEEVLFDLARSGEPFWCHQGMRRPTMWRHPDGRVIEADPKDYHPPKDRTGVPYKADGTAALLCGGWSAVAAKTSAEFFPDWLMKLVDGQAAGRIPPGGMIWKDPPPKARASGRPTSAPRGIPITRALEPLPGAPAPSIKVRQKMYDHLRRNPNRWALMYCGAWNSASVVSQWFRKHGGGLPLETLLRREGLVVSTYARFPTEFVPEDVET